MNDRMLNFALYEKLCDEQDRFRAWLLLQPPEEILKHACEYTVRESVVTSFAVRDLPRAEALALLKSSSPLAQIYRDWNNQAYKCVEDLWAIIGNRAKSAIQTQGRAAKRKARDKER